MVSYRKTVNGSLSSMLRYTLLLLTAICLLMAATPSADARSRGISIGIGVGTGLVILKSLSGGKSRQRAGRYSRSKKYGTRSSRMVHSARRSKGKSRRNMDGDDSIPVEAATEPATVEPAEAQTQPAPATGSTAPAVTGALPTAAVGASEKISTTAEITAAQEHLRYLGYDVPSISGSVDLPTKIAVMKFQESISAPTTGELTVEQLKRMFVLASERQSKAP